MSYTRYVSIFSRNDGNFKDPFNKVFHLNSEIPNVPYLKVKITILKFERKHVTDRSLDGFFKRLGKALKKAIKAFGSEI